MSQSNLSFDFNQPSEPVSTGHVGQMEPEEILDGLNEAQQKAVLATDGAVLIIAGPGSGKTRTLTHRIAYLLATGKARPWEVLAITFTNKAAREMRERVLDLVGHDTGKGMSIGTFHSMFARLMRVEGGRIGYSSDFTIYDTDDTERVIRDLMNRFNIDTKEIKPRSVRGLISGAKNRMVSPSEYERMATTTMQVRAAELYKPYEDQLRAANAMDFDDLLIKPIRLFEQHPDVLEKYQDRWRFIHIDEYQDTNRAQYTLARMLARKVGNLCVVGDDAQSIYSFRGADITNILSFQRDYPNAATIRLEQNYRSTQKIVRLADSIIKNNRQQLDKELWTDNEEGDPVTVLESISEKDEAQKVERRIRDVQVRLGYLYKDFAVLYRTNAQSRSMEDSFRRAGIPYRVVGGVSFYQRKEIKDALAYLRLVVNPNDVASLRRVINLPTRGIGDKSQDALFGYAAQRDMGVWEALERVHETGLAGRAAAAVAKFRDSIDAWRAKGDAEPASVVARGVIKDSGLLEDLRREQTPENLMRWENVQELLNAISEFSEARADDGTLSAFLQEISLMTDADDKDDSENRVTLMTLHGSKGLEFPVVFLTGVEDGLFPLQATTQDPEELEEERRLFYVGATRAKRLLFLSHARSRYRFGDQQPAIRSRFFEEVDPSVLCTETGQAFDPDYDRFNMRASGSGPSYDSMDPFYYRKNLRESGMASPVSNKRSTTTIRRQVTEVDVDEPASIPSGGGGRRVVYDEEESTGISPGMKVEHHLFGEGKVLAMEGAGRQAKATVYFKSVGQKKLILRFARLQRIE